MDDFKSLREQNVPFVDKTNFITDFMNDEHKHIIITRPRGFGKSYTQSMLYHFFNIYSNSSDLFKGTSVANNRGFCQTYQNQHPVIRVSLAGLENAETWMEAETLIKNAFRKMFDDHKHMIDVKTLAVSEMESRLNVDVTQMIRKLSEQLYGVLKKKSIVVIDGYDTPIRTAFYNGYYDQMVGLFRSLYRSTLQNNPSLHRSLILGESGVGRAELFSEVHHLASYTLIDRRYVSYFGFNTTETLKLIQSYRLNTCLIENMVKKYGGYWFSDNIFLNPYSVTQCLKNNGDFMNYWMDSERDFVKLMNSSGIVPLFESEWLLNRHSISHAYDVNLTYPSIKKDLDAFWTLITDSGYVTITETQLQLRGGYNYKLAIPNEEVFNGFSKFPNSFYAKHKNIVPYIEWTDIILSHNSSGSLNCLKSYFSSALRYFAAEEVNDPLSQMKVLVTTIFKGLRKFYKIEKTNWEEDLFIIDLKGRPSDFPLRIAVIYAHKKNLYSCLVPMSKFFLQYYRLLWRIRFGSSIVGDKVIMYYLMDTKGNWLKKTFSLIDRWVGQPVENMETKLRTCLKKWFLGNLE